MTNSFQLAVRYYEGDLGRNETLFDDFDHGSLLLFRQSVPIHNSNFSLFLIWMKAEMGISILKSRMNDSFKIWWRWRQLKN